MKKLTMNENNIFMGANVYNRHSMNIKLQRVIYKTMKRYNIVLMLKSNKTYEL